MEDIQVQIRRVKRYERMMCEANRIMALEDAPAESLAKLQKLLQKLDTYYRSDAWKQDYAADEAGLLPKNLKRGVLSEDGLYHLLEEYNAKDSQS